MGILDSLRENRGGGLLAAERRAATNEEHLQTVSESSGWMITGINTDLLRSAGVEVTTATALNMPAVHACWQLIGGTVASLPLVTYERLRPRGRQRATSHGIYRLLHDQPNPEIDAFQYVETLMLHLLSRGNCYSEKEFDRGGRLIGLWPLLPDRTYPRREDGRKEYVTHTPDGQRFVLPASKVFHVAGLGFDGMKGYSPLAMAGKAIGLGLAAQTSAANFFANGFNPGGVLEHPQELDDESRKRLKKDWRENRSGLENHHRLMILEEGMKWTKIGVDPTAAQLLESRQFAVEEIARFYNVPPHMIGHSEGSTSWGSGIEQQTIGFVSFTLRRWLVRWEKAIAAQLFSPAEQATYYAQFLLDALLRGDSKTRAEALEIERRNGIINANDWRELEDLNPIPGPAGEVYTVPLNWISADHLSAEPDPAPAALSFDSPSRGNQSRAVRGGPREVRSLAVRRRLRGTHERLFRDAGERILRREVTGVRNVVSRWAKRRSAGAELLEELSRFYDRHGDEVRRAILPPVSVLAAAVHDAIQEELAATDQIGPELERFVDQYAASYRARHVGSSLGQLRQIIQDAAAEDIEEDVEERLGEWEETRPAKIGTREVSQAINAVARTAYVLLGVQVLRWVTSGSKTCGICQGMDGREVTASRTFVAAGDTVDGGEDQEPITVENDVHHPPIHDGCVCDIAPA